MVGNMLIAWFSRDRMSCARDGEPRRLCQIGSSVRPVAIDSRGMPHILGHRRERARGGRSRRVERMGKGRRAAVVAVLLASVAALPCAAETFRFASDRDVKALDPYARNETFHLSFVGSIYEPLIRRDRKLQIEPALATEWAQVAPELWRFKLRRGVTFHDGSPFTADDVVFSFARVRMDESSLKPAVATIRGVSKVDDSTVEIATDGPDPILPEEITHWYMMCKRWAEENDAVTPADPAHGED